MQEFSVSYNNLVSDWILRWSSVIVTYLLVMNLVCKKLSIFYEDLVFIRDILSFFGDSLFLRGVVREFYQKSWQKTAMFSVVLEKKC